MLARAIGSVLTQTHTNLELIVVDDASTVDVKKVVGRFKDSRISYVRRSENGGVAAARNTGIKLATGEYVAFLDDDDLYLKYKIERQLKVFEESQPSVGVVYCGVLTVGEDGRIISRFVWRNKQRPAAEQMTRPGATALVKKACFEEIGLFDEDFECFEDWDMWLRMSDKYDFGICPEPLYLVHVHSVPTRRLTDSLEMILGFIELFYQKHANRLKSLPEVTRKKIYSKYHDVRAISFYDSNMIREGREEAIKSILLDPLHFSPWKLAFGGAFGPKVYHRLKALRDDFVSGLLLPEMG